MCAMAVRSTALCSCSFSMPPGVGTPVPLNATSSPTVLIEGLPAATIMDKNPMVNIPTFGMCTSPSNPTVAAAQGAPMPCVPAIVAPWTPGSPKVLIKGKPALVNTCTCMCNWGGVITIKSPGATHTQIN